MNSHLLMAGIDEFKRPFFKLIISDEKKSAPYGTDPLWGRRTPLISSGRRPRHTICDIQHTKYNIRIYDGKAFENENFNKTVLLEF
jgi:hypothetical protein